MVLYVTRLIKFNHFCFFTFNYYIAYLQISKQILDIVRIKILTQNLYDMTQSMIYHP